MVRRLRPVNFLRPAEPNKLNEIMDRPSSSSSGQLGIKIPILDRPNEEITWLHRKTVSALLLLASLINVRLWEILRCFEDGISNSKLPYVRILQKSYQLKSNPRYVYFLNLMAYLRLKWALVLKKRKKKRKVSTKYLNLSKNFWVSLQFVCKGIILLNIRREIIRP